MLEGIGTVAKGNISSRLAWTIWRDLIRDRDRQTDGRVGMWRNKESYRKMTHGITDRQR